ncbi:cullin-4-like protein [Gongronella butleri]|nr:cullin-4-like protein [Gongronella butleri]
MPPRQSAKKRKAPDGNQSTLDSFRLGGVRAKAPATGATSSSAVPRASASKAPENKSVPKEPKTRANDSLNAASLLGSFRRQPLVDRIVIQQCQQDDSRPDVLPDDKIQASWKKLEALLNAILKGETPTSFQEAYRICQTMCLYNQAKFLHDNLKTTLDKHIHTEGEILSKAVDDEALFLDTLNTHWTKLDQQLATIRNIFMELDRRYVMRETEHASIVELGKTMFRKTIMEVPRIQARTVAQLLDLIKRHRDGETVDETLIKSMTQMLHDLSLYVDYFEPGFLTATDEYYAKEAEEKLRTLLPQAYLLHAEKRIREETARTLKYLQFCTKTPCAECVIRNLIHDQHESLLDRGFDNMMDDDDKEPLKILNDYLLEHHGRDRLRAAFGSYIKKRGLEMIKDPSKDNRMVPSLLAYKGRLDDVLDKVFRNNASFVNVLKESFEQFINTRNNKPAEQLAKFIDQKLRAQGKKQADDDLEATLDRVLVIFRFLQGKDTFEAFYKRYLAKRLLLNRSVAHDMEKSVLEKIKNECGPDFTKNLEGMFKDIEISLDLNNAFKESKEYADVSNQRSAFSVNVLAQAFWPTYSSSEVIMPQNVSNCSFFSFFLFMLTWVPFSQMVELQNAYEAFYKATHKGKRLTWRNALGTCTVKARFAQGLKELAVSQFQAVVLLLFNDADTLTYKEIATATNLDDKELRRIMVSLSRGESKALLKERQDAADIQDDEKFTFNAGLTSDKFRLRFNMLQQEQSPEENKDTQAKVLVNRQHQLEAAIVRIMKAKKTLTHAALVNELFQQLKFPLDATDIKKRIETLIDRDYLSRDPKDNSLYHYQS